MGTRANTDRLTAGDPPSAVVSGLVSSGGAVESASGCSGCVRSIHFRSSAWSIRIEQELQTMEHKIKAMDIPAIFFWR